MRAYREDIDYWRSCKEWYVYDEKKRCYYLTEKAPKQAYESFMAYILYEKKKGRLQDNSPYDVYGIIIKNY